MNGIGRESSHRCTKITHGEMTDLFNRSKRRWEAKRTRVGPVYNRKAHMTWVDETNQGVSHFGIHPDLLPPDNIRFDCFHMKCAITRKLMNWLRTFLLKQSTEVVEDFSANILKKVWNDFHLYVWRNRKSFASFQGNELALFVGNIEQIAQFLESHFQSTNEIEDFIHSLRL